MNVPFREYGPERQWHDGLPHLVCGFSEEVSLTAQSELLCADCQLLRLPIATPNAALHIKLVKPCPVSQRST